MQNDQLQKLISRSLAEWLVLIPALPQLTFTSGHQMEFQGDGGGGGGLKCEGEVWIFSGTEQISKVITEITVML